MASPSPSAAQLAVGAAGGLLLLVVLVDVFVTIFAYDGFTFLTQRFHRLAWASARVATSRLPTRSRHTVLSLSSALLLPATLVFWLALETAAFGMIFVPGVAGGGFVATHHAARGGGTAFYLSGGLLTSLSFGDLTPASSFFRAMSDLETAVGLATFTLALTYVLSAFDALAKLHGLYGRVRRNAVKPQRPSTIIERRYRRGDTSYFSDFLQAVVEELDAYAENLRRFPVAIYFHTRRLERGTPHILGALGRLIELSRWGLPPGEAVTTDPNLLTLVDGYRDALERLRTSFLPGSASTPSGDDLRPLEATPEELAAFERLKAEALGAAGLEDRSSPQERAEQRREWLGFHRPTTDVLDTLSRTLGYEERR